MSSTTLQSAASKRPKLHHHATTHSPLPHLPGDVITLILSWLPVKPLLKFRCVSRSWLSLISSYDFSKTHLVNSKRCCLRHCWMMLSFGNKCVWQCSLSLFLKQPIIRPVSGLPIPPQSNSFTIVGSCDGLICLAFLDTKELVLLNPSTRKLKYLPDYGETSLSSKCAFGFGFDYSSNDYKVVGFFTNLSGPTPDSIVKAYSLKTGQWKKIEGSVTVVGMDEPPLFVNGRFYWINKVLFPLVGERVLCCLDLETEVYTKYALPDVITRDVGNYSLAVSERLVYLMTTQRNHALVWIVYEDGVKAVWKNVFTIGYADVHPKFPLGYSYKCQFYVLNNEESMVLLSQAKLMIINLKDGSCSFSDVTGRSRDIAAWACVESLVSV